MRPLRWFPSTSPVCNHRVFWSPAKSESTATASSDFQPPTTPSSRNRRPPSSK
ncbi:hypothetical protein PIB30_056365, partial [Stylosanthes scabra]|nr:hypothetical protein [Stylosanthes scabra]